MCQLRTMGLRYISWPLRCRLQVAAFGVEPGVRGLPARGTWPLSVRCFALSITPASAAGGGCESRCSPPACAYGLARRGPVLQALNAGTSSRDTLQSVHCGLG